MILEELNNSVWATIRPSKIHGVGVFAIRDIPKYMKLYSKPLPREWITLKKGYAVHPAIMKLISQRWPRALEGQPFLSPNDDVFLTSFMNHSETPNYDPTYDHVTRFVRAGEEITEDYGDLRETLLKLQ